LAAVQHKNTAEFTEIAEHLGAGCRPPVEKHFSSVLKSICEISVCKHRRKKRMSRPIRYTKSETTSVHRTLTAVLGCDPFIDHGGYIFIYKYLFTNYIYIYRNKQKMTLYRG
jgi:hypothetical protein